MPDKLSKLQSYSLNKTAGDVKLIKLKDTYKKRTNIDERISRIKRDQDIPLTGRANELSELRRIYFTQKKKLTALKDLKNTHTTNNSEETPVVAGIRGEAGIGKTRLVNEFLKPHSKNHITGISDNSVLSPYSLFISMIKKYADISNSDPKDLIKSKLKFILQDLSNYEKNKTGKRNLLGTYNLLCYLLGVTQQRVDHRLKLPAAELKIHLQLAIRVFIEAIASKVNYTGEPLIVVFEDIHWIDDSSASAITYILNTLNIGSGKDAIPKIIIFLFLYRPEFKVMKEAEQKSEFTEIRLEALDYNSVQKIINSKAGKGKNAMLTDPIPEATVKKLAERSEGNPLFIQEWMKMLGDKYTREELIAIKKHKLKFERSDIEIPDSINLLIEKRLDRLTESELQVLQYASVTGNEFSDVLLKGMAELLSNNSRIDEIINALIESKFIQASEKVFGNEKYYRFHHDVIRKVVYESIPASSKKILHKTAGEVIEDVFGEKIDQYYYALCDHFEKGGAEEKTIEYLEKAGDKA
ncbi:MAG: AAA family ATPase, partial [bacterium]